MPLACYGLSSLNDDCTTPIPTSETVAPLKWPLSLAPTKQSLIQGTGQEHVQLYTPSLTRGARELSARSSTTFNSTKSSSVPRQPQDWFSQLPPKLRRAQFSPSEKAHIQRSNDLDTSTNYSMHSATRSNPRLRQSASTSAWSSTSAALSDITSPTMYTSRTSIESTNSRADYKYPTPTYTGRTSLSGGFMTSPASRSGDNPRPSLSLRPRKASTSEMFSPMSPNPRKTAPRYLHDPETQTKLKLYFGSEEKFDEVLVYGFPSTDEQAGIVAGTPPKPTRPPPNSRAKMIAISDYQKALKHDSLAFLDESEDDNDDYDYYEDDDDDDEAENDVNNDPNDEHEHVEYCYDIPACKTRRSKADLFPDYDNCVNNSVHDFPTSQSRPFSAGRFFGLDRDSTLRITLTRPEVRAVDNVQNSVEDRNDTDGPAHATDLLALEPLEILPDHTALAMLSKQTTPSSLSSNKEHAIKNMFTRMKPRGGHSPWLCV